MKDLDSRGALVELIFKVFTDAGDIGDNIARYMDGFLTGTRPQYRNKVIEKVA